VFRTDGYDAAVYLFESDLPGRIASVALSGEGSRLSASIRAEPLSGLGISASLAATLYSDRRVISAGSDRQIDGSTQSIAGIQVDLAL
jgi:hypothetical protein